jgi:hypothetical protein
VNNDRHHLSRPISVIRHDPIVERELSIFEQALGEDFEPYRNRVYRVLSYSMHLLNDPSWQETLAFALAHHDAGLWTAGEMAYLEPSEEGAESARRARAPHLDGRLVHDIIHWHHKLTSFAGPNAIVVNAVRKADWLDVTAGLLRAGISRRDIRTVLGELPPIGFHRRLTELTGELGGNTVRGIARFLTSVLKI